MITNNNVEAYIELLKARVKELEKNADDFPGMFHIHSELFNARKELLSVWDTAEYNSRHMNTIKASSNYQTSHLRVTEQIAYASESQASALTRQACALEKIAEALAALNKGTGA